MLPPPPARALRTDKPMGDRRRLFLLALLMIGACTVVLTFVVGMLHLHEIRERRGMLQVVARSQARLIEAISGNEAAEADRESHEKPDDSSSEALVADVADAHECYRDFGNTGELILVRRDGDSIVQLHVHRKEGVDSHSSVAFDSPAAVPMRRALLGESGTVIGPDYRGVRVLSAYEPVAGLNLGIVVKVVVKLDLAPAIDSIEADASQIRQIVMNLITNASEAIGDKTGVISLRTGVVAAEWKYLSAFSIDHDLPEGPYVYLEVSDTGCGMEAQVTKRIFDPFFTTKVTGRGLGLAAVLGIVRGHRGGIRVRSEPMLGTTFTLIFPSAGQAVPISSKDAVEAPEERLGGIVLVIDDEEIVRNTAKRMLERAGFGVVTAANGREAIQRLRDHPEEIAAVLLDLTMPQMDGIETYGQIQRLRPSMSVILSSGYNEQEATGRFAGKGLAGFIQKPYEARFLIEKMREALKAEGRARS